VPAKVRAFIDFVVGMMPGLRSKGDDGGACQRPSAAVLEALRRE
jgi:hypothetical protein